MMVEAAEPVRSEVRPFLGCVAVLLALIMAGFLALLYAKDGGGRRHAELCRGFPEVRSQLESALLLPQDAALDALAAHGVVKVRVDADLVFFVCYHTMWAPGGYQVGGYLHAPALGLKPSGVFDDQGVRVNVEHLDGAWYAYWWNS